MKKSHLLRRKNQLFLKLSQNRHHVVQGLGKVEAKRIAFSREMIQKFLRMKTASTTAPSATIRLLNQNSLEGMSVAIGRLRSACTRARCVKCASQTKSIYFIIRKLMKRKDLSVSHAMRNLQQKRIFSSIDSFIPRT
uniref:(northern house mosquito) hypothetical protein n=1 Tax=Culex pipiens TaxID=7175 RepID=A0A8D8AJT6_CULPI